MVARAAKSMAGGVRASLQGLVLSLLATGGVATGQDIALSALGTTHPGFLINGIDAGDRSGVSVSGAGDVNGDGLADVIVGARDADPFGLSSAGESYVIFGRSGNSSVDLSTIGAPGDTNGFRIDGTTASARAGYSVSMAGDVNGDGLADLIVGAYRDTSYWGTVGVSYIVFGKSSGSTIVLSNIGLPGNTNGFRIEGINSLDYCGWSVSGAGDVNGDGLGDVVVGAPRSESSGLGFNVGEAYVVFGKSDNAVVPLSSFGTVGNTSGFRIDGIDDDDQAGLSVSGAGDVNGDGRADIILGAYKADAGGDNDAGESYVVFGKTGNATIALSQLGTMGNANGFRIDGIDTFDNSGAGVSGAGDVNGDGFADVIIGASFADPGGLAVAGEAYVVFGKVGNGTVDLALLGTFGDTQGFRIDGIDAGDGLGTSVSGAGDINGDGLADVITGATGANSGGDNNAGECYVVFGKTSGATVAASALGTGGFRVDSFGGGLLGCSLSTAGDVNGDGLADLVIGARSAGPGGMLLTGQSYVVFSPYGFPPLSPESSTPAYLARVAAGDPDRQGVGTCSDGDDATMFPNSRLWVDFDDGQGSGPRATSEVRVDLWRFAPFVFSPPQSDVANVLWSLQTDRNGWTECRVTVRYTEAEIAGLTEGQLQLYRAPALSGPFTPVSSPTLDVARNEASGLIHFTPSYLILTDYVPAPNGDANYDGSINVADFTAIHNHVAGIAALPSEGDGDVDNDTDVDLNDANALREFLVNGTPLP